MTIAEQSVGRGAADRVFPEVKVGGPRPGQRPRYPTNRSHTQTFERPPMATEIEIAFAIQFAVLGLAHLIQPGPLISFYQLLASKNDAGVISIALLSLITGSFLVAFHNIWTGLPILLTVFGWAQLAKGVLYLLIPSIGLRLFERVTPDRINHFRWPGIPLVVISGLLAWHLIRQ